MPLTVVDQGLLSSTAQYTGFKNRIINGAMVIDQRNAGAAVTINSGAHTYTVDRWSGFGQTSDGVFTVQRSSVAPAGFINSLLTTVTTADASIGASQFYGLRQAIEGFNISDFGFGTATAQPITLSFWVRSSLTGTFSGSVTNGAYNRAYPFAYSVSAANTWEQKTVTVSGDTTGTWATDNSAGLYLYFDLGSGSSNKGTAGVWNAGGLVGVTGSVNLISTNGATFYITGVQLEKGSTATSFDYRPYGTELALCQRYYWQLSSSDKGGHVNGIIYQGWADTATSSIGIVQFPMTMRTSPTLSTSGTIGDYVFRAPQSQGISPACSAVPTLGTSGTNYVRIGASTSGTFTVGAGHYFSFSSNTTGYVGFSSEL
jgi:hypothetical protein